MASFVKAVLLVCFLYTVCGASVYKQYGITKTSRDFGTVHRTVNIVKRSSYVPTFETETVGRALQKNGSDVFRETLRKHRGVFKQNVSGKNTFKKIMENIFKLTNQKDWIGMSDVICSELRKKNYNASEFVNKSNSNDMFYKQIIKLYTFRILYHDVNLVLRDYMEQSKSPFGPYALMLNVILSQWTDLRPYSGTTYRGVDFETHKYTVNTIFTWTSFTSSSSKRTVGCNFIMNTTNKVLFTIDNSADSDWRPRGIKALSQYKVENEYLYPAIAIFKITAVNIEKCTDQGKTYDVIGIHLRLQRGETEGSVNVAAIIGGTAGGFAFLAIVESVVVGVLLT